MYHYRSLSETSLAQLADCFNLAFSDYEQPIHFSPDSLSYYLTASAVDLSLSFGAFHDDELVGIILNSAGIYDNKTAVYDAGTGIVPKHRGKKVFTALFNYTLQRLQEQGIEKYYLETLQANHHAIAIYKKVGFSIRREYSVLVASGTTNKRNSRITSVPYSDFSAFSTNISVDPSFEHTIHAVERAPQLYNVLYLNDQAYCIYAKRNGELIQMHYNTLDAMKEVISALITEYPSAYAKNIDYRYPDVIQLLIDLGFNEITKQFEMVRDI